MDPALGKGRDAPGQAALPEYLLQPRVLLQRFGIRPRKGLGQHFLVDRSVLQPMLAAAELGPDDLVLEIGPGLGVLTDALAARAGHVVAVELDPDMRRVLREVLAHRRNVTVAAADILTVDPARLFEVVEAPYRDRGYTVVANLPYHITSAVLRHILELPEKPRRAVVMVQKEVAERILAQPGDLSILAVAVQLYAEPSPVAFVPSRAFYPRPKVDSAVLRLDVRASPAANVEDVDAFFRTVRAGFSQRRKQLRNSLAAGLDCAPEAARDALEAAGIEPSRRAQTLDLDDWARLTRAARRLCGPGAEAGPTDAGPTASNAGQAD